MSSGVAACGAGGHGGWVGSEGTGAVALKHMVIRLWRADHRRGQSLASVGNGG